MKTGTVKVAMKFVRNEAPMRSDGSADVIESRTVNVAFDARQDDDGNVFAQIDGRWRQLEDGQFTWI